MAETCRNCGGDEWVCENHSDRGWPSVCDCGAGAPCPVCRWDMATAGVIGSALSPDEIMKEAEKRQRKPLYKSGHEFHGPDGQGYRLTRDVHFGDAVLPGMLEPFGGAPDPEYGEMLQPWLARQVCGKGGKK